MRHHIRVSWAALKLACLAILLTSCHSRDVKFIPTTVEGYYLIWNVPHDKKTLAEKITAFISEQRKNNSTFSDVYFYRYTNNTAYFIGHKPDPGGHFSEDFDFYEDDRIATFGIEPASNDTAKRLALLRFYNDWGNYYQPDTLFKGNIANSK